MQKIAQSNSYDIMLDAASTVSGLSISASEEVFIASAKYYDSGEWHDIDFNILGVPQKQVIVCAGVLRLDFILEFIRCTALSFTGENLDAITNIELLDLAAAEPYFSLPIKSDGSVPMTAPLTLPRDPELPLQAATKQYVDAQQKEKYIEIPIFERIGNQVKLKDERDKITLDMLSLSGTRDDAIINSGGITSKNYSPRTRGYKVSTAGDADFRSITAAEMRVKVFVTDFERAFNGSEIVSPSRSPLAAPFLIPAEGESGNLIVEEFPGSVVHVFGDGDTIQMRQFSRESGSLNYANIWGTVVYSSRNGFATPSTQTYTFTRSTGANAGDGYGVIAKGTLALDHGVSGDGCYEVSAIDVAYAQTKSWTTHPATGSVIKVRMGNLAGIHDDDFGGDLTGHGLYAVDNVYIKGKIVMTNQGSITISGFNNDAGFITSSEAGNKTYYGNTAPTYKSVGDFWFDKSGESYVMKRWNGTAWDVVSVYLDGDGVYAGNITAGQVTAGIFTGLTFRTSDDTKRIEISSANSIEFYYDDEVIASIEPCDIGITITGGGLLVAGELKSTGAFYLSEVAGSNESIWYSTANNKICYQGFDHGHTLATEDWVTSQGYVTGTPWTTWAEAALPSCSTTGYVLSSTSAGIRSWVANGGSSMVYPDAGIPLSTGSAWGTSITNNSANWNTAYGWGNHASAGYVTGTPWTSCGYLTGTPWLSYGAFYLPEVAGSNESIWYSTAHNKICYQGFDHGHTLATEDWVTSQGYVTGTPWTTWAAAASHNHAASAINSGTISDTYIASAATWNAKVSFPGFGTTNVLACVGNDARLSDARTPTSHNHNSLYLGINDTAAYASGANVADYAYNGPFLSSSDGRISGWDAAAVWLDAILSQCYYLSLRLDSVESWIANH